MTSFRVYEIYIYIYINDLHQSIHYNNTILFADDTTIIQGHKNLKYLKWSMEEGLKNMMDWFKANLLTINLDKTECLIFQNHNNNSQPSIKLDLGDQTIRNSDKVRFLGVWIDHKLHWTKHTNTLLMKLKQNTNLLQIGNKFLNKASKKLVYYAHIYSHITYGIVVWGNMVDKSTKSKIQKCMDKCFNLKTHLTPTLMNYKKEKMLRLEDLITLENTKLSYKLQRNLLPMRLQEMLLTDSKRHLLEKKHRYQTRSKEIPYRPAALTRQYHTSFLFQSLKDFENVSLDVRHTKSLSSFTSKMKQKLLMN